MLSKVYSVFLSIAAFFFSLTLAFAVPILFRPFYYIQIRLLGLEASTGFSYEIIKEAFDEVMDYLVFRAPFGTGSLIWSESGKSHFEDCQRLFQLDFIVLLLSSLVILVILILSHRKKIQVHSFNGRSPFFYAGAFSIIFVILLGLWGMLSFDTLFVTFHRVLFPGKTNWIFDAVTDQIILILPESFFFSCGALVLLIILLLSMIWMITGRNKSS